MSGDGFFEQFIEEYFAECDEHLATARHALLDLEGAVGQPPAAPVLQELLRSLHTLKGLSGMVGVVAAERLAHAMEEALRARMRPDAPVEATIVDTLFASVDLLERCILARRSQSAAPDIAPMLAKLGAKAPAESAKPAPASATAREAAAAEEPEGLVHHFEFAPTRELTDRGIGVDAIRARLRSLGTLLDAKPRVAAGSVIFDFWVSVEMGRAPDEQWRNDGLTWTAVPQPAPAETTSPAPGDAARAADSGAAAALQPVTTAGANVVRVDLGRLDGVMRLVGDLVISRSRLDDLLRHGGRDGGKAMRDALEETNTLMERQLRRLREAVMRIRLVPVGEVFERLRFAVRDAARESGKRISLQLHGQNTEIDKLVVDRMLEPLLHLVRNAVSHGIERPEERVARGKPAEGTLILRAAATGDRVSVDVEDDGAGIDTARVEARARARGLLAANEPLGADALLDVLCTPGLSTRDEADMTSGRGVGMDVVRSTIRSLAGELSLFTTPGKGTRFVVELPLTLMIVDALLVEIGGQQMAVPQPVLREILKVERSEIVPFENNDVVPWRGGLLPLLSLSRLFRFPETRPPSVYLLVVGSESAPMGLVVDRLLGLREIVVHPVADPLVAVDGISGATELGDGRVSLILDSAAIVRLAQEERAARAWSGGSANVATTRGAAAAPSLPS
ncbi:MAG TPA: chemotaxis protein CheA [Gemmatimonadaceae bacterium]|nr:chemotaxis protein CheA [Gemmatimonadaceae bacterium]